MNKEIKKEKKKLQSHSCDNKVEDVSVGKKGNHHKWRWNMLNENGEIVRCQVTIPNSPSDWRWKKNHHRNIRMIYRNLKISGYRIQ